MRLLAYLRSLAAKFARRSWVEDEIEEELRAHIQSRADDLERSGLDRAEAERRAHIEFGGRERFREESYQALGGNFIESLGQDVLFAVRVLRKSPGFAITAVLTLAMAIGANALVFSFLNGLILRPLNVPDAETLYAIERASDNDLSQSYPDYLDLRSRNRSFDDLAAYSINSVLLDIDKNPTPVWGVEASGNYFDALRIQPYLGRFFHSRDEHGPNSAPFMVLSYSYWHSHFHDDPGVLGRTVQINRHPFTVIGVAPPEFRGAVLFFSPAFFVPMVNREYVDGENDLNARGSRWVFMVLGHLKPDVTPAQAAADLNSIGADLEKRYPKDERKMSIALARPGLLGDLLGQPVRAFLAGLMLLAVLILLAACANLGSLFAARASDRAREIALRLALGSSRRRILRSLFTESLLVSLAGGAVGLWGSILLLHALAGWQPFGSFTVHAPVSPDARVYGVALLLSLASGLLFVAVPLKQIVRTDPYEVVKSGLPGRIGPRLTLRDALLVVQIAICAVLITSSMVAVRGLVHSLHSNFGFEMQHAMLVETDLNNAGYRGPGVAAMQQHMTDAIAAIPGVDVVGLSDGVPVGEGGGSSAIFTDKTIELKPSSAAAESVMYKISPEYFRAAGTTVLAGRAFTAHDDQNAPRVAVINQEFAHRVFGSTAQAIGGYFKLPDGARVQVVGIVEDGKYNTLTEDPLPAMFLPILQSPSSTVTWLVARSNLETQQLATAIRGKLRNLDDGLYVETTTWTAKLEGVRFPARVATFSLGVLGLMGAVLAVTGIFGMCAYSVRKRLREFGIRIALGAQRKKLLQAALARPFKLLVLGSAAGLLLSLLASQLLAYIVYQATSRDPLVLAGSLVAMALLGLLATWAPAQRALSVDPLILLREE